MADLVAPRGFQRLNRCRDLLKELVVCLLKGCPIWIFGPCYRGKAVRCGIPARLMILSTNNAPKFNQPNLNDLKTMKYSSRISFKCKTFRPRYLVAYLGSVRLYPPILLGDFDKIPLGMWLAQGKVYYLTDL